MNVLWLIVQIAIYTFVLSVLFRQMYNLIFVLAKRPVIWIVAVAVLGTANMGVAYAFSWNPRLVGVATLMAVILNIAPPIPKGSSKTEFHASVDEVYKAWGVTHGRLKSKLGLIAFGAASVVAYVLFFGESCTLGGECTPIIKTFFS